jgi:radical SAM superfamily enzyme YgiQ (UPF0313 family)
MRILLLAMPDTSDVIDFFTRIPNMAIISLAGNLPGHEVKALDLVLYKPRIKEPLETILAEFRPQMVGLSAMTFQFDTLLRVARFIRNFDPAIKLAAGGYHVSLMSEELTGPGADLPLDFLIRGEGEITFRELADQLARPRPNCRNILGLSYRQAGKWRHNPDRPLLDLAQLPLPHRRARVADGFYVLDLPMDVAETSRGCPYNCKFCSITQMYGHTFRRFPLERIIADLEAIRQGGKKAVFFGDDNITHDVSHFRQVCQAIVAHGLNDLVYSTQVSAVGIAQNPELVADMDRANFRHIFVGFESMVAGDLKGIKKPTSPEINRRAAALLRRHHMAVIAGCIVGYPEDTQESIRENYGLIKELLPDMIYAQYLTPYPKTRLRQEMLEADLVVNPDDFHTYDGFTCNIRTRHLSREELFRCLKREAFKGYFEPSLIAANYFLRHHLGFFLKAVAKSMATNLYQVLTSRQRGARLDI